jgi:hypothetical protein
VPRKCDDRRIKQVAVIYLADRQYNDLVDSLANMPFDDASSREDVADAIQMALGHAGLWLTRILADVIRSRRAEAAFVEVLDG